MATCDGTAVSVFQKVIHNLIVTGVQWVRVSKRVRVIRAGYAYVEDRLELLMIWEKNWSAASPVESEPQV